jgi:hypothetical protein
MTAVAVAIRRSSSSRWIRRPQVRPSKGFLLGIFFIIFLSVFCKNIWSYICRRGPRRQGHNVVAHGGRSRQQWARSVRRT